MYTDQTLSCRDCGRSFTFTSGQQEFFASKGFANKPGRCDDCRAVSKAGDSTRSSSFGRQPPGNIQSDVWPVWRRCGSSIRTADRKTGLLPRLLLIAASLPLGKL